MFGFEADISGLSSTASGSSGYFNFAKQDQLVEHPCAAALALRSHPARCSTVPGGVAFGGVKNTFDGGGPVYSESKTKTGWVAGGGIEYMLSRNWTVGAEGLVHRSWQQHLWLRRLQDHKVQEPGHPSAA